MLFPLTLVWKVMIRSSVFIFILSQSQATISGCIYTIAYRQPRPLLLRYVLSICLCLPVCWQTFISDDQTGWRRRGDQHVRRLLTLRDEDVLGGKRQSLQANWPPLSSPPSPAGLRARGELGLGTRVCCILSRWDNTRPIQAHSFPARPLINKEHGSDVIRKIIGRGGAGWK